MPRLVRGNPLGSSIETAEITNGSVTGVKVATGVRVMEVCGGLGYKQGDTAVGIPATGGFLHPAMWLPNALAPPTAADSDTLESRMHMVRPGTCRRLRFIQQGEGAAGDLVVTILKNGVATTVTLTASAAIQSLTTDLTHEFTFAAGDYLQMSLDHGGAGTVTVAGHWSFELEFSDA